MAHIDIATRGVGKVSHHGFYEAGGLTRVDEDMAGDGIPDKWEIRRYGAPVSVEININLDGKPDCRLKHRSGGVRAEKLR